MDLSIQLDPAATQPRRLSPDTLVSIADNEESVVALRSQGPKQPEPARG